MKKIRANIRRILILSITLLITIISVVLGSLFYLKDNSRESLEYVGGAEYVVKVELPKNINHETAKKITTDVAESIYNRLNPNGVANIKVNTEEDNSSTYVHVRYSGIKTEKKLNEIQNFIIEKPTLTFTNLKNDAIFDNNGIFKLNKEYGSSHVPIANGGAKATLNNQGKWEVQITLDSQEAVENFRKATEYLSKPENGKTIITWINLNKFIKEIEKWNQNNPNYQIDKKTFIKLHIYPEQEC